MDHLLCGEEISWSPMWIHPGRCNEILSAEEPLISNCSLDLFNKSVVDIEDEHAEFLLDQELQYMPDRQYIAELQSGSVFCDGRCRAIRWMVEAQHSFHFSSLTTALAVNYLDRYLSTNLSKVWKTWMFELLSVACLSIAAKMEEIVVPQLVDLQVGATENPFDSETIQRMELIVLSTLDWKVRSITPFSFVELVLCGLHVSQHLYHSLYMRISELILGAVAEAEFLEFCPSMLAATAIYCALEEVAPSQVEELKANAACTFFQNKERFSSCYKLMEDLVIDPPTRVRNPLDGSPKCHLSPVTPVEAGKSNITEKALESASSSSGNSDNKYICVSRFTDKRKRKRSMEA